MKQLRNYINIRNIIETKYTIYTDKDDKYINEIEEQNGVETDKLSKWTYSALTSGYMVEKILSCMLMFDLQTQQEYCTFKDTHQADPWKTGHGVRSVEGLFYNYTFPLCN